MNLISIIVPMYNEQENVKQCVDVLKKQSNQDFDVIFIDDGSTDATVYTLKEYLTENIKFDYEIIQQENKGAASARESGLKCTKTEFIMIFDCDDKLSENLVGEIYAKYHENNDVDIVIPNMKKQNEHGEWEDQYFYIDDEKLNPIACILNSLNGWAVHGCFAVRKTILEKSYADYQIYNKYSKNYVNNDEVITRLNFSNAKKIIRCKEAYYFYCHNLKSTTKRVNENRYLMVNNALILRSVFYSNELLKSKVLEELVGVVWGVFSYMHKHKVEIRNINEWKLALAKVIKEIPYFEFVAPINFKKKVQLTMLKLAYL